MLLIERIDAVREESGTMIRLMNAIIPRVNFNVVRYKYNVDYSKIPQLKEEELEVQYVRGSGPGGQSVNKTANCVVLKHLPTNLVVKCHETRSVDQNLKRAKESLINKLDILINKEDSVEAQMKRFERKKLLDNNRRKEKLKLLKENWKKRENIK